MSLRACLLFLSLLLPVVCRQPNVLFVITDDQDTLALPVMPALRERIVAQGMSFDAAHTSSPICCPSRTSLFSGRYSHNLDDPELGWCGNFSSDGEEEDNFLTALSTVGYRVLQAGKWFNQEAKFLPPYLPQWYNKSRGDEFFVMTEEGVYINNTFNLNGLPFRASPSTLGGSYLTASLGNRSVQWLREATAGDSPAPWVAYIAPHAPHLPATPAPWYADAEVPEARAPRLPAYNLGWEDKHWQVDNGIDKPMSQALMDGGDVLWRSRLRTLMSVDDLLAAALDVVEGAGAWTRENTYVIYTSDHAYHIGLWGLWCEKAQPYDPDTRVPLAIRGPGVARIPGRVG
jgi:N-acetylglucosamine-6-sulfatase